MTSPFTHPQPKGEPPYHVRDFNPADAARHLELLNAAKRLQEAQKR